MIEFIELICLDRLQRQMAVGQPLYASGRIEFRPFGAQYGDRITLAAQFAAQLGHAFGLKGGVKFDLVDKRRCKDQRANDQDIKKAHAYRPFKASASDGTCGNRSEETSGRAGPPVRSAARSLAERARGLRTISSSSAATGRLVSVRNVAGGCLTSGM